MKNKWEVINECDDEEGNHTCWSKSPLFVMETLAIL